ncbi:MATE family efflux transporter [Beduinella massiliensis]|uniref:MATE family efflux transporter n=1 Tax=Beduinella massiliensis TaxID=1852363 RepID=UPI0031F73D72
MKAPQSPQEKFSVMTTERIPPLVLRLAAPTIVSMLVTSLYNMADTFFVGRIGTSATGAVGVVFSLMAIIQALGFTFGHGSGNFISRRLGAQDTEGAEAMASTGFFSALITGLAVMVLGLLFLDPLVQSLGATPTILPYARDYARFILIGSPYMIASLVLNNQLRFQGSAAYAMVGIASGAVINVVLDPLLIFGLNMGVAGAALATIISQFVSFCLLLVGTHRGCNIPIRFKAFKPSKIRYREILRGGFPSLCRQGLGSIATIALNLAAGPYGDAAIAAMSIVSRVMQFAMSAVIGFGQGFQPVCGFNYGAKLYGRVREAFFFCLRISFVILLVMSVLGIFFAPQVIEIFRKGDPAVVQIGQSALRLQCILFPFVAYITMVNMMLQTIGKSLRASVLAAARQGLFFLPVILILPRAFGLTGLLLSQPVADLFTLLLALPLGIGTLNEMKRMEEAN